jgi:ATP-binding cassette subfamily B protein
MIIRPGTCRLAPLPLRSRLPDSSNPLPTAAPAANWALLRRLLGLGWSYRWQCFLIILQQMLRVAMSLSGLGLVGLGIDALRHELDPAAAAPRWPFGFSPAPETPPLVGILLIAGGIVGLSLTQGIIRWCAELSSARLVERIVVQLRSDVYDKLQRLGFRFFNANETGSIINRVAGDVQSVRMFVDGVMVQMVVVALSLAVFLAYMLRIHVWLTIACLATTPLLWVVAVIFSRLVRPQYVANRTLADRMVLTLSENVQGVSVVKGFAREEAEAAKFHEASNRVRAQKHKIFWQLSLFQPVMAFLTNINLIVLLGYGGHLIILGQLRLGEGLFVFAGLLQQFANQVDQIVNITNRIQTSLTGAQRVFEVLDAPVEIQSPPEARPLPRARGAVTFEQVEFAYKPDQPVLQGIDFAVEPGACVALVGATGAGKSTLLSLIPRLYDASAGRVLIDGKDVRQYDLDDLRRNIGVVFQESFLFSNTVADNIAFGHPEATREQIEQAARIAAAHEFILDLPDGYETYVGEYGANLSGGQRQRLAIARALVLAPPILILDDATAAIDPQTEHEILLAMENAMRGRTTFVIAHRLSTLRRADLVIVLNEGRIEQIGSHEELMSREGHYRRAAMLQMAGTRTAPHFALGHGVPA